MSCLVRPVILSGGSGTRLWPVSRKHYPKQFAPLLGNESLFTETLKRVGDRAQFAAPLVVGNVDHRFLMLDCLEQLGIKDAIIFLEPLGRNTAAAALIAAIAEEKTAKKGGKKVLHLVMPSDHVIADKAAFLRALDTARPAAEEGKLVLFGITPSRPDTGFGYILCSDKTAHAGVNKIEKFCEKPAENVAKELIDKGAVWNSGIFFYDPAVLLKEAERLMPDDLALCRKALDKAQNDFTGIKLSETLYAKLGNQPFDRAIMEKTDKGAAVACDMGWSDLGSWEALWQIEKKDDQKNAVIGPVVLRNTEGCYIRSYGPTVATMGVSDLAIVAMKDAVLIAPRAYSQEVRELADDVSNTKKSLALDHPRVMRPWGSYEGIALGEQFQVKHIIVAPKRSLSLQMHHHRAEHWIVVAGTAEVQCGDTKKTVLPNESVYIPIGAKHRLRNPGDVDLQLIEVQSGDYLGEDDIVRFEDAYGRVGK
ncbi:MAG: mannose-1-phosphate guanylyltransferase/mannose-6-phosphate isomerase [Bdellovibrionales bacterium]